MLSPSYYLWSPLRVMQFIRNAEIINYMLICSFIFLWKKYFSCLCEENMFLFLWIWSSTFYHLTGILDCVISFAVAVSVSDVKTSWSQIHSITKWLSTQRQNGSGRSLVDSLFHRRSLSYSSRSHRYCTQCDNYSEQVSTWKTRNFNIIKSFFKHKFLLKIWKEEIIMKLPV